MTAAPCTLLLGLINWQGSQVLPGGSGLHQALNLPANVRRGRNLLMGAPPSWKASFDNLGGGTVEPPLNQEGAWVTTNGFLGGWVSSTAGLLLSEPWEPGLELLLTLPFTQGRLMHP